MSHDLSRENCRPETGQRFTVDAKEFVLGGKIGDGAVGLVRKATSVQDKQTYAIKFLAPDPKYINENAFGDVYARFKREGERGPKLSHPNLLQIHAFNENLMGSAFALRRPTNPFLLMKYIHGRTLENHIRAAHTTSQRRFDITPEKLSIAIQISQAVEYLHKKPQALVHRDVKPGNVFLSNARPPRLAPEATLGDFGIVKWGDFHSSLSTGVLTATNQEGLGTMKYMSPEQAIRPKEVTVKSDIYSLGITLFELFTDEILASPHHVFEVMNARLYRGTTAGRFYNMNCAISPADQSIGELVLDMHLRGADGRPSIDKVVGRLSVELERRTTED